MAYIQKRETYLEILKEELPPKRLQHSIGVEQTAEKLARWFGADVEKAQIAGLLHDIAKNKTVQEMRQAMENVNKKPDANIEQNKSLLHGPAGAAILEAQYGITDREILSAVEYHTTGKPDMSQLEKIIYLADMIEPNRDFPGIERLRDSAGRNLDEAVLEAMAQAISFVVEEKKWLHPISVAAYNDLLKKRRSVDAGADE